MVEIFRMVNILNINITVSDNLNRPPANFFDTPEDADISESATDFFLISWNKGRLGSIINRLFKNSSRLIFYSKM